MNVIRRVALGWLRADRTSALQPSVLAHKRDHALDALAVEVDGVWPSAFGSMAPPDGLEPPTRTLGRCRSIH